MAIHKKNRGFTLVEALVGVALVTVIFTGIFGAYRLGLKVLALSKNKITATAIANSEIEKIRNLPYASVGVENAVLPAAAGGLDAETTQTINGVLFTITTAVQYVIDTADGTGMADECNWDYKKADVTVSWSGSLAGRVKISTTLSPESMVQEAQTCLSQPGGILAVTVFDTAGTLVPSPFVQIYKMPDNSLADSATPANGTYSFPLVAGTYRIMVSKNDYSSSRTYDSTEVAVPENPDLAVYEGNSTAKSLSIGRVANISIDGISPAGMGSFSDSFEDQSQISDINGVQVAAGSIKLDGPPYAPSGWAISKEIAPADLLSWRELTFSENIPASTAAFYQVLFFDGTDWVLIPDHNLGGNSAGLTGSLVQLGGLDASIYPKLKIKASLSSSDSSMTPQIDNWQVAWDSKTGLPIANAAVNVRGEAVIGKDAAGENVYKYSQNFNLDPSGHKDLNGVDPDNYHFSVDPASGFSLAGTDPISPVAAPPGGSASVKLYLTPQNSFLATVQDQQTLSPIFSAQVRLTNSPIGYDNTQFSDQNGQAYFAPLADGTYGLSVQSVGYADYSGTVNISGQAVTIVGLAES